ncbi:hypothetical protein GCK72_001763 [Caenorhabditis remanei]|uniref:PAN-3 domain-containing protein n=1 Tax=Caenorhabditis remanei TaxID=31234 RepID=A0A6A5HT80_CAERE|nr:hypothetical protein GCK72_001763 [Caenorhabditis remanei]KAF1769946.1 hypothetical protein GCK72_001763 [Caenorhabditis remanei]
MVLIHGEPRTFTNYSMSFLNWNSCMSYCYQMLTCIAVHYYDQNPECQIFEIGKINDLKQLDAYSGKIMAVKMLSDPTQCSSTSDGNSMRGEISTESSYQNYNITVDQDIWTISASPLYTCPDSFKLFHRVLGMWCMGVILKQNPNGINQIDSTQLCADKYNAILSGFDSTPEKRWVVDLANTVIYPNPPYKFNAYWVNGIRKDICRYSNQTQNPECQDKNAFDITDPTMSTLNAYVWAPYQPDGMQNNLGTSNCLLFRVGPQDGAGVDDRPCDSLKQPNEVFNNGFICGLRPAET